MKKTLLFLVLFPLLNACYGTVLHQFPGVTGEEGVLINVTISQIPGNGQVELAINPMVGLELQKSLLAAKQAAERLYQKRYGKTPETCTYSVSFAPKIRLVEGPSGGAQFAVLFYSLLVHKAVRKDAIMSATISPDGTLGEVSGLYEKICAASAYGYKYFLTAPLSVMEYIPAVEASKKCNITLIQLPTLEQAVEFMIYNKTPPVEEENFTLADIPNTNISAFPYDCPKCRMLALAMVKEEEQAYDELKPLISGEDGVVQGLAKLIEAQRKLINKRYYYTAANSAFLTYGALQALLGEKLSAPTLEKRKHEIIAASEALTFPKLTTQNIAWIAGGEARKWWAIEKAKGGKSEGIKESNGLLNQQLAYAHGWLLTAELVKASAETKGKPLSESALEKEAERLALRVQNMNLSAHLQWYKRVGDTMLLHHAYAGAIFTYTYVEAMGRKECYYTDKELGEFTRLNLSNPWAKAYLAHARYFFLNGDKKTACTLVFLALELEDEFKKLAVEAKTSAKRTQITAPKNTELHQSDQEKALLPYKIALATTTISAITMLIVGAFLNRSPRRPAHQPQREHSQKLRGKEN